MYDKTVTVFNYFESTDGASWYSHVLSGVDLNTDKGAILKKYGADSSDNAELHIAYLESNDKKLIQDSSGSYLLWMPPKAWRRQEERSGTITFGANDFFMSGEWHEGVVRDEDYREGFYSYINNLYDFVFKITNVGGPYTMIPHFEILGK